MSGGEFDYIDCKVTEFTVQLLRLVNENEHGLSAETNEKMRLLGYISLMTSQMMHYADYLYSCDTSEVDFNTDFDAELIRLRRLITPEVK